MFYIFVNHFIAGQVIYYAIPEVYFDYVARYLVFPMLSYLIFEAFLAWVSGESEKREGRGSYAEDAHFSLAISQGRDCGKQG